jgi:hypothetical protein
VFRGDFSAEGLFAITAITLLSLNLALKLTDIQLVTDFSDSSDSKNGENFSFIDTSFFSTLNENHMLTRGPGITGIL